jgi:hypothetical protein
VVTEIVAGDTTDNKWENGDKFLKKVVDITDCGFKYPVRCL